MKFTWWSMIIAGVLLFIVGRVVNGLLGDSAVLIGVVMVLVGLLTGYRTLKDNKQKKKTTK